ncbi:MAG: hypothetical protein JXA74_01345 [Anaerolineae bacterium]|nr:hypothetical protein [Anaerolineae bacterium]
MTFFQVWLSGYYSPGRFARGLLDRPAPQWGLLAVGLRAALISLGLYLPLHLLGRTPPLRSYLPFIPTERYYGALVWITPLVLVAQWLLDGALTHVLLRLLRRPSDLDQILNIYGLSALVVGAFLMVWDWAWIAIGIAWDPYGGIDQFLLGTSHLVLDVWGLVLAVVALKGLLGVPIWLGVALDLLAVAASLPLAIMFMRSPL